MSDQNQSEIKLFSLRKKRRGSTQSNVRSEVSGGFILKLRKFCFLFYFILLMPVLVRADWIDSSSHAQVRIDASHNDQYPQFAAWVTELTKRLEQSVNQKLQRSHPKILKGVYVYHIDGENGGVSVLNKSQESEYAIFIDTDFMKDLFLKTSNPSLSLAEREKELAHALRVMEGAIAHEMGHVVHEGKSYLYRDQLAEVEADLTAVQLLRSAGLKREVEIEAQQYISSLSAQQRNPSFEQSGVSTHPTGDVRESASRINTTWDRFTTGTLPVNEPQYSVDLLKELNHFPVETNMPQTLDEALEQVARGQQLSEVAEKELSQKISHLRYPGEMERFLDNSDFVSQICSLINTKRSLDWLFVRLSAADVQQVVSQAQKDRFVELVSHRFQARHQHPLLHPNQIENVSSVCKKMQMTKKVKRDELSRSVEKSPFLSSPEYIQVIEKNLRLELPKEELNLFDDVRSYTSDRVIARMMRDQLYTSKFSNVDHWEKDLLSERVQSIRLQLMSEISHQIRQDPEVALREMEEHGNQSELFRRIKFFEGATDEEQWKGISPATQESIRGLAQWIWDHRARIGLLGFNWAEIWKILGIPESRGRTELKAAVLENARGGQPSRLSQSFFEWINDPNDHWFSPSINRVYFKKRDKQLVNSPDSWGGIELFRELKRVASDENLRSDEGLRSQEEGMTDSFHQLLAQEMMDDWKKSGKPSSEFGSYFNKNYMEISEKQDQHTALDMKYKLPFLIGSQRKANSNKFNRFMNLHEEYPFWREVLKLLDQDQSIPFETKKAYLKSLTNDFTGRGSEEAANPDLPCFSRDLVAAVPLLLKYQVFQGGDELFKWASGYGFGRFKDMDADDLCENREGLLSFMDQYLEPRAHELAEEMRTVDSQKVMAKAREYLNPPIPGLGKGARKLGKGKDGFRGGRLSQYPDVVTCMDSEFSLRNFKKILVDELLKHEEASSDILSHFDLLTLTGSNEVTDGYLRARLKQLKDDSSLQKLIRKLDLDRQIHDEGLRADLVEYGLDHELKTSKRKKTFDEVLTVLKSKLENSSSARDRLLEKYAWKYPELGLKDLQEKVQPLKVGSIDGQGLPMVTNLISMIGVGLSRASLEQKLDWLRYIKDPSPMNKAKVFEQVMRWDLSDRLSDKRKMITPEQLMDQMDSMVHQASPLARVPILDFILGQKLENGLRLYQTAELKAELSRLSGFASGSQEERILQAYLDACPDYEQSPIISYFLMHQKGGGKGGIDLRPLFEVFSTLGIKTGQLAAIFDQVDAESKEDLSLLKDQAKDLDKAEVLGILKETMRDDFDRVKVKRILGSASIKNVIEVEWDDGRHSAVMIRRPYAKPLVQEHLIRSARFMENLKKDPVLMRDQHFQQKLVAFQTLGEIVKAELKEEVEFEKELENTGKAGKLHGTSLNPKKVDSSGWTIQVPQADPHYPGVHRVGAVGAVGAAARGADSQSPEIQQASASADAAPVVMFMEMAKGSPIKKLQDPAVRSQVGRTIVRELVTQLFTQGFMNADPHQGNFLVNPETQTIYPIDFGQAETLRRPHLFHSKDEVEILAHFFAAFNCQDIPRIVVYGSQFCDPEPSPEVQLQIQQRLMELKRTDQLNLIEIINAFHDLNAKLSKRSFGILKGLAVLQKEGYVSEEEFKEILAQAIYSVLNGTWSTRTRYGTDRLLQKKDQFIELLERVMRLGRDPMPAGSCPR